jgi:N utilization substance protein B
MPAARHRSRKRALQVVFNWDMRRESVDVDAAIAHYYLTLHSDDPDVETELKPDPFMEELVRGTISAMPGIDKQIEAKATNWRIERMPAVDRNVLRLAIFEMQQNLLPRNIIIDEAIELARQFSGDESLPFINGVLDAINKENAAVGKKQ